MMQYLQWQITLVQTSGSLSSSNKFKINSQNIFINMQKNLAVRSLVYSMILHKIAPNFLI